MTLPRPVPTMPRHRGGLASALLYLFPRQCRPAVDAGRVCHGDHRFAGMLWQTSPEADVAVVLDVPADWRVDEGGSYRPRLMMTGCGSKSAVCWAGSASVAAIVSTIDRVRCSTCRSGNKARPAAMILWTNRVTRNADSRPTCRPVCRNTNCPALTPSAPPISAMNSKVRLRLRQWVRSAQCLSKTTMAQVTTFTVTR